MNVNVKEIIRLKEQIKKLNNDLVFYKHCYRYCVHFILKNCYSFAPNTSIYNSYYNAVSNNIMSIVKEELK